MTKKATIENTRAKINSKITLIKKLRQSLTLLEYRISKLEIDIESLSKLEKILENSGSTTNKEMRF